MAEPLIRCRHGGSGALAARFDLTDEEWIVIERLPPPVRRGGARRDDRQVSNGIFHVLRTGIPRDDPPERYGPSGTVHDRYDRWSEQGI